MYLQNTFYKYNPFCVEIMDYLGVNTASIIKKISLIHLRKSITRTTLFYIQASHPLWAVYLTGIHINSRDATCIG